MGPLVTLAWQSEKKSLGELAQHYLQCMVNGNHLNHTNKLD